MKVAERLLELAVMGRMALYTDIDGTISPIEGSRFAAIDRSAGGSTRSGVISADDPAVRAFRRIGWVWGGTWNSSKDYQHFSASGR